METCAVTPSPKKLFSRANVRSMNWSTITNCAGREVLAQRSDRGDARRCRSRRPASVRRCWRGSRDAWATADDRGRGAAGSASFRPPSSAKRMSSDGSPRGSLDPPPLGVFEARQVVEPGPADDAETASMLTPRTIRDANAQFMSS